MKPTEVIGEYRTYTVVGLPVTGLDTMRLHKAIMRHNASLICRAHQERILIVLSIDSPSESEDFKLLSARFGERFDHFALLNDVAVDVFKAVGFGLKVLGEVDERELRGTPYTLIKLPFWSEISSGAVSGFE
jgi:hypothetical protein